MKKGKPLINPKIKPKWYWFVTPEMYPYINKTLGSLFNNDDINSFIKKYPKGIYITYDKQMSVDYHKWGHMPYPDHNSNHDEKNPRMKPSKNWLKRWGFRFKGEISRRSKLEILNKKASL